MQTQGYEGAETEGMANNYQPNLRPIQGWRDDSAIIGYAHNQKHKRLIPQASTNPENYK